MLLRVYEAAGFYEEDLRVSECFHVKCGFECCLGGLFYGCFVESFVF